MKHWIETLRSVWALAVFWYRTFVAPWPPFTIFMAASAVIAVVTPTVIVRATSGLIDAITRAVGPSPNEASLRRASGAGTSLACPSTRSEGCDSVIQMDAPFLFLARKLGLHSMARLEDLLYEQGHEPQAGVVRVPALLRRPSARHGAQRADERDGAELAAAAGTERARDRVPGGRAYCSPSRLSTGACRWPC